MMFDVKATYIHMIFIIADYNSIYKRQIKLHKVSFTVATVGFFRQNAVEAK